MPKKNRINSGFLGPKQYDIMSGILTPDKIYQVEKNDMTKWTGSGVTSFNSLTENGVGDYFFPFPDHRPTFWLDMPTLVEGDQKFTALLAIYKGATGNTGATADPNYAFFTIQGNYIVDWGNGVTQSFTGGTIAQYQYNYETIGATTETPDGYRQVIIQAYPQPGATLTSIDLRTRGFTALGIAQSVWGPSWLEIKVAGRNITSMSMNQGGGNAATLNLRRFEFVGESNISGAVDLFAYMGNLQVVKIPKMIKNATSLTGMFQSCGSLRYISDFEISPSVTSLSGLFIGCPFKKAPNINTANITNMQNLFYQCGRLESLPTYNTSKVTNFSGMFYQCYNLRTIPPFDTSSGTNFSNMFAWCYNLTELPPIDTGNATIMEGFFEACAHLRSIPRLNTSKVTNFANFYRYINMPRVPWMDTSSATNMAGMFWISAVQEIPFYDTRKVTSFQNFFNINNNIKYMPPLSGACCSNFSGVFSSGLQQLRVGTFVDVSANISYSGCSMITSDELNNIFRNLAVVGASGSGTRTITITNTAGATFCDRSIAIAKGWAVVS